MVGASKFKCSKCNATEACAAHRLSPVRAALITGDSEAVIEAMKSNTIEAGGCWEWQGGIDREGYGRVTTAAKGRFSSAHRVMAEAHYGPLGKQTVHHRCANRGCVNPDHLQPISNRENLAEMFQRTYYLDRIAELEAALSSLAPGHPALT
jgi:hypothetical protein